MLSSQSPISLQLNTAPSPSFNSRIISEFQSLPQPPNCRQKAREQFASAITRENHPKNRYPDVLPYENTRVKLSGASDYINANFIQDKAYISCQAPLPQTFADFWRMIWEYNIAAVVMLTKFLERRRIKAHCYWPSEEGQKEIFGDLAVSLVDISFVEAEKITIRKFKIFNAEGEVKDVAHIHYTDWPDCGVPKSSSGLRKVLELMDHFSATKPNSPVVVHCSAGIGRAGTLIAVHSFLNQYFTTNESITVSRVVENMRSCRMGMVQTKEQYQFIYQCIEDIFSAKGLESVTPKRSLSFTQENLLF